MRLVELREQVERISEEMARTVGATALGTTTTADVGAVLRAAPEAVSWESWSLVSEAAAAAEGKRAQRLKSLRHFVFELLERAATAETAQKRQSVEVGLISGAQPGEQLALRTALAELGNVDNRDQRLALERRSAETLIESSAPFARKLEQLQSVAQKAGFASTMQAHAALGGLDLTALATEAQALLTATDAMYEDVLSWWLRRTLGLRLFPHGAERHDLLHAIALRPFEGVFPARRDLTRLGARLERMGLPPSAEGRIRVDLENRATKDPETVAFPVVAPREVWLSVRGARGFDLTRRFLSGLGAAQHWANIEAERPFEDRSTGDRAIPFGVGEAFAGNLMAAKWIRKVLEVDAPDLPRLTALSFLTRTRLAATRFLYSAQVDREGITAGLSRQYAERLSQAMRVDWPSGLWLFDADAGLDSATDLRAIAWGHSLRSSLIEQFDEDWWSNPRSGAFLLKLFSEGQFTPIGDLATRFSIAPPDLGRLSSFFEQALM